MIFVPLPLFAVLLLVLVFTRIVLSRDMTNRSHQLFALLVALYALQSLLLTLRWGYGIAAAANAAAFLAPALPALAYLSYRTLKTAIQGLELWPLGFVVANWFALIAYPSAVDALILVTFFIFGVLLLVSAWKGASQLALSPLASIHEVRFAMGITGAALLASALTDIYLIVDFIQYEGRHVPLVVTIVQTTFGLLIGFSALFGRAAVSPESQMNESPIQSAHATLEDEEVMARLAGLFENEHMHRNDELSLRRLARRLQMPDRKVSNAINRVRRISVSQFVNEYRVNDACERLISTDDSILAISLAAGFATKSNFNREFQRIKRVSPSQWRNQNKRTTAST